LGEKAAAGTFAGCTAAVAAPPFDGGLRCLSDGSLPPFHWMIDVSMRFPTSAYIEAAMELATYEKLKDGSFAGEIPPLKGVASFGRSLRECKSELRSTVKDWLSVGLELRQPLPNLDFLLLFSDVDRNIKEGRLISNAEMKARISKWTRKLKKQCR
jgi:predicted RNase H-like HicB family nuclease